MELLKVVTELCSQLIHFLSFAVKSQDYYQRYMNIRTSIITPYEERLRVFLAAMSFHKRYFHPVNIVKGTISIDSVSSVSHSRDILSLTPYQLMAPSILGLASPQTYTITNGGCLHPSLNTAHEYHRVSHLNLLRGHPDDTTDPEVQDLSSPLDFQIFGQGSNGCGRLYVAVIDPK